MFSEETQVNYIIKVIKPILSGGVSTVDIKEAPTKAYNDTIQRKLKQTIWTACFSWYNQDVSNLVLCCGTRNITSLLLVGREEHWYVDRDMD